MVGWRKLTAGFLILSFLLTPFNTALAQFNAPRQVNYQAKLTDASNVAVADGTYNVAFRLYTAPVSATTTNIWEENRTGASKVTVANGLLSVMLGSVTPLTGVNFNQTLYLGVEIGGTSTPAWDGEMSPRKQLGAVPASLVSDTLDGFDHQDFVKTSATSTLAASSASTLLTLNQQGAGNIMQLQANGTTVFTANTSGNIGIGTTSPYAKLAVVGQTVSEYFSATSTTLVNTFPLLTSTNATTTNLNVSNNLTLTGGTTTASNGINLSAGCFAIGGTCLTSGTSYTDAQARNATLGLFPATTSANTWSAEQTFSGGLIATLSTTTGATTTDFFSTRGTITALNATNLIVTNSTSTNSAVTSETVGTLTFTSATGTSATTTNLFANTFATLSALLTNATATNLNVTNNVTVSGATSTFAGITLSSGCFRNSQGTCVGGGKESTYVVAAANSINRAYADYVADYTNDEVEINAAINAAYSASRGRGGKVYLLEGDFRTSTGAGDKIIVASSTSLIGSGEGTTITVASSTNGSANIIVIKSASTTVRDLSILGNKTNQASGSMVGVLVYKATSTLVENVQANAFRGGYGFYVESSAQVTLRGNTANDNQWNGFAITGLTSTVTSRQVSLIGNRASGNTSDAISIGSFGEPVYETLIADNVLAGGGIQIDDSYQTIVRGNIIRGCYSGCSAAIYVVNNPTNITIEGNQMSNIPDAYGVYVTSGESVSIMNNHFAGIGYGAIYANSWLPNMSIVGNVINGYGVSTPEPGIGISNDAPHTLVANNLIYSTTGDGNAIRIYAGTPDVTVVGNQYSGAGAARITDSGTNTKYTQWDRLTLDTKSLGQVAYSLLDINASSSTSTINIMQMGSGPIARFGNATSTFLALEGNGNVGIGTTSPYARLSVVGQTVAEYFTATGTATSSFAGGLSSAGGLRVTNGSVRFDALGNCDVKTDGSGNFYCGTDAGAGGTSEINWAYFNNSGIRVSTTTNQVLIGGSATTSLAILEVQGSAQLSGGITALASSTIQYLSSTLATTTAATSTDFFSARGLISALLWGSATGTDLSLSQQLTAPVASITNLISLGSSTLQYFNSASSTLGTTLITGNATTTGALYIGGATTTAANGIQLLAGCFRNSAGTCVGGGKESTYVVAAQNSTNKVYADYVANGAGAETAINAALQAAYASGRGGKVYLMEGDYNLSTGAGNKIVMASSTSLIGAGPSTVIHIASSTNASVNAIVATSAYFVTISDIQFDGNDARNAGVQNGIVFTSVASSTIRNIVATATSQYGISLTSSNENIITQNRLAESEQSGIALTSSSENIISDNSITGGGNSGIMLETSSLKNQISANTIVGNTGGYGIFINTSSDNTFVNDNIFKQNGYGIYLATANNAVTGNTIMNSVLDGITVTQNGNEIVGNFLSGNGTKGIYITSAASRNNISGNTLLNNGASGNSSAITIDQTSSNNIVSGNQINDTAGTGYAIAITSLAVGNILSANYYSGVGASSISDFATGTTRYTQWDRLTLDTKQLGQVAYSLIDINASSSTSTVNIMQMGSGPVARFGNSTSTFLTLEGNGNLGIGTSSPWSTLSVTGSGLTNPFAVASSTGADMLRLGADGRLTFGNSTTANILMNGGATSTNAALGTSNVAIGNQAFSYYGVGAEYNIALGYQSLYGSAASPMGGDYNFAAGYKSLMNNTTGSYNTALGYNALYSNTTGGANTAIGYLALLENLTGSSNIAIGQYALQNNDDGSNNIALGDSSLNDNLYGNENIAIGLNALNRNIDGWYNVALGGSTLFYNTSGQNNSALGYRALNRNTTGYYNVALGETALFANTTGYNNVGLGMCAGCANTVGTSSVFIGDDAGNSGTPANLFNATAIGSHAQINRSHAMVLGGTGAYNVDVAIGTTSPWAKLSLQNSYGSTTALFDVATTTSSGFATTSIFRVNADNTVTFGGGTTTMANGINLSSGCFAIGSVCVGGTGGSQTPWTSNIFANSFALQNVGSLSATSSVITQSTSTNLQVTGQFINTSTATSTFAGGIQLTGGCFRDTSATSTCIGKGQAATYVVAASNSKNKDYADYIADGTGDQNEINAAIQAAYTASRGMGGKVYLLEGDFSVNGTTTMATGTMLIGSGRGTVLRLADSVNSNLNIIDANYTPYVSITDLSIDGNKGNNSGLQKGIYFNRVSSSTIRYVGATSTTRYGIHLTNSSNGNTISGNTVNENTTTGIYIQSSSNNTIIGNSVNTNSTYGILIYDSNYNTVTNNSVYGSQHGITLDNVANYNVVTGNISRGNSNGVWLSSSSNNTVSGNTLSSNSSAGIYLTIASSNTITGNTANNNSSYGIILQNSSTNNDVTGNAANSNSTYGIFLLNSSDSNTVSGNKLYNNAGSGGNSSIYVDSSSGNLISSNHITDTAGIGYAIQILSTSASTTLVGNYYNGAGANSISDAGANTKYTQWDRLTLDTKQLGQVAYSLVDINASSSTSTINIMQMGSGPIARFGNATSTFLTLQGNGNLGVGSSSPWSTLSVTGSGLTNPFAVASSTGSSMLAISTMGRMLFGTTTNANIFLGGGSTTTDFSYRGQRNVAIGQEAFSNISTTASDNIALGYQSLYGSSSVPMTGGGNFAAGYQSLMKNTTGYENVSIGIQSLTNNKSGYFNTAFGSYSLYQNISGTNNIAIGYSALQENTTGSSNNAFGYESQFYNQAGHNNNALGFRSLKFNTSGFDNNAVGENALINNTSGSYNNAFGNGALAQNRTGYFNIALGAWSLYSNTTGSSSVAMGFNALSNSTTGASSTAIGTRSGLTNITGNNNLYLGDEADSASAALSNASAIGSHAIVGASNSLVLGGTGTWAVDVAIGTTSPWAKLSIQNTYGSTTALFDVATTTSAGFATSSIFRVNADGTVAFGGGTTTMANGIQLSAGCFRNSAGTCVGGGKESTYVVAAQNSTNKTYADYVADGAGAETAINAALQAAYASGRGGKVYLLEGDYYLSTGAGDKVQMATGTSLIGAGQSTVIHIASSTNATANAIMANTLSSITIADLYIDGNGARNSGSQNGIKFNAVSTSTISNVTATGTTAHGIFLSSSFNNILTGNTSNANGFYGIWAFSSNNNTIAGNTANGNAQDSIYLQSSSNNTVTGNTANGNTLYGISLSSSHNNTVTANTTNGNINYGILLSSSNDNTVTSNNSNRNGAYGIYLSSATGNTLAANITNSNTSTGIYLSSSNNNSVVANTTNSNTNFGGIYLFSSVGNTLTANIANSNGRHGIYLYTSSNNNIVSSNRLDGNGASAGYSGIFLDASTGNLLSSNQITDTAGTSYAILVNSNATGNTLVGNNYSGIGASSIGDFATSSTRYSQWDRLTLDTKQLGQVAYNILNINASSSTSTINIMQMGSGPVARFGNATSTFLTLEGNGSLGVGSSTPGQFILAASGTAMLTGTTTIGIGGGQTGWVAGLQIPNGSICVDNDGACVATSSGNINARTYGTGGTDLAENYFATTSLEAGDIVMFNGSTTFVTLADSAHLSRVAGIVSTAPGLTLGVDLDQDFSFAPHPIALSGRVPVKVNLEHGIIRQGDRITLSSIPGIGAKSISTSSLTVGIAMEDFSGATGVMDTMAHGTILTFVNLSYQDLDRRIVGSAIDLMSSTTGAIVSLFDLDEENAEVRYRADRPMNFSGTALKNVRALFSSSGKWSLGEDGSLVVETVEAKTVRVTERLQVGTPDNRTGVTLFDEVDGTEYCIKMLAGVLTSIPGDCASAVPLVPPPPASPVVSEEVLPPAEVPTEEPVTEEVSADIPPAPAEPVGEITSEPAPEEVTEVPPESEPELIPEPAPPPVNVAEAG